jgi:hypothetical protein
MRLPLAHYDKVNAMLEDALEQGLCEKQPRKASSQQLLSAEVHRTVRTKKPQQTQE